MTGRTRTASRIRGEIRLTGLAIWRGVVGIYHSNDLTFASSIAYYALLSLFPFFLLAFSILGSVTVNTSDRAEILGFVLRYFPRHFEFVTSQLDALQGARIRLGIAGSVVMIWAAMGVFSAITSAVNHAWGVERQPSYFKHKLIALLMLIAASVLLLAGLLLVSAINVIEARWFAVVLVRTPALAILQNILVKIGSTAVFIFVVGLIFYFVPNAEVRFRDVWVGAVVTGLLWRGALFGFSWYLRVRMQSLTNVHGSIAAVVVFLVWVYTCAVLFLYGVEVTAANARLRRHRPEEIPAAPAPRM
ncbi:MAG TPA: YihY/virulence factor BrkB family protein [Vicinamibacterales bacterium]|nr:YihY/virulence factor BrkB family protein [Vicinamibacterales bacterium]